LVLAGFVFYQTIKSKSKNHFNSDGLLVYHGGCLDCISQLHYGLKRCNGCKFKTPNWNLPDLSVKKPESLFNPDGILIYHGGCLGCKRQKNEGINGCISCQYQNADWSLPNLFVG
jgi:hypothetical protein